LSSPMAAAASATSGRKGHITAVRRAVSSSLPGTAAKPGAKRRVSGSDRRMPRAAIPPTTTRIAEKTAEARRQPACGPSTVNARVTVGTKAADRAPSAKRSRSRFGIRKATVKASAAGPALAPNRAPKTISRARPKTRLTDVAAPTRPAAFRRPGAAGGAERAWASLAGIAGGAYGTRPAASTPARGGWKFGCPPPRFSRGNALSTTPRSLRLHPASRPVARGGGGGRAPLRGLRRQWRTAAGPTSASYFTRGWTSVSCFSR
jgi:hypothetical protein